MGRTELLRDLCRLSGITSYAWRRLPPGLYVFNYHRIGDPATTAFDPDVFSCSEQRFVQHIELIRSRFEVIGLPQLLTMIQDETSPRCPTAMITFDDGYRDNYTKAFPALQTAATPATFFITTGYIGGNGVAWWDEVVWQARRITPERMDRVPWLRGAIPKERRSPLSRHVLRAFKRSPLSVDEKLAHLRDASGCIVDTAECAGLFMNWDEVRALRRAGMAIGSHTHTHPILSHLAASDQHAELATSKRILQAELAEEILALAYPVGRANTYSEDTIRAARSCDYRVAFTFITGVNEQPARNPFELGRIAVEDDAAPDDFRFATARLSMGTPRMHKVRRAFDRVLVPIRERLQAIRGDRG